MTPWDLASPALPAHHVKPWPYKPLPEYVPIVFSDGSYALVKNHYLGADWWNARSPIKPFAGRHNRFFMPLHKPGEILYFFIEPGFYFDGNGNVHGLRWNISTIYLFYSVIHPRWPGAIKLDTISLSSMSISGVVGAYGIGYSYILKPLFATNGKCLMAFMRYNIEGKPHPVSYGGMVELQMPVDAQKPTLQVHLPESIPGKTIRETTNPTCNSTISGRSLQYHVDGFYDVYSASLSATNITPGDPGASIMSEKRYPLSSADGSILTLHYVQEIDRSATLSVDMSAEIDAAMDYTPGAIRAAGAGAYEVYGLENVYNVITWKSYQDHRIYRKSTTITQRISLEKDGKPLNPPISFEIKSENLLVWDSTCAVSNYSPSSADWRVNGQSCASSTALSPEYWGVTLNWVSSYHVTTDLPVHLEVSDQVSGVVENFGTGSDSGSTQEIWGNAGIRELVIPTPDGVLIDVVIGAYVVRVMMTTRGIVCSDPVDNRSGSSPIDFDQDGNPLDEQSVWRTTYNPVTGQFYERAMDLR